MMVPLISVYCSTNLPSFLQCAMLSPTFKVRDFSVTDIQPYPIKLKWHTSMEGEEGCVS